MNINSDAISKTQTKNGEKNTKYTIESLAIGNMIVILRVGTSPYLSINTSGFSNKSILIKYEYNNNINKIRVLQQY